MLCSAFCPYIRWSDQIIVFNRTVIDPTNHRTST